MSQHGPHCRPKDFFDPKVEILKLSPTPGVFLNGAHVNGTKGKCAECRSCPEGTRHVPRVENFLLAVP